MVGPLKNTACCTDCLP